MSDNNANSSNSSISSNCGGELSSSSTIRVATHRLVVIRHSERIDERKDLKDEWKAMRDTHLESLTLYKRRLADEKKAIKSLKNINHCDGNSSITPLPLSTSLSSSSSSETKTDRQNKLKLDKPDMQLLNFFIDDCPITKVGAGIATNVAQLLKPAFTGVSKIFTSKLLRSVQTAYEIAKHYNVPLHLSRGFSLKALAVQEAEEEHPSSGFQFKSMEVLRRLCPGVELIDCDDCGPDSAHFIPSSNWYESLAYVAAKEPLSIVVAHRETIKDLWNCWAKIPYCGFGIFDTDIEFEMMGRLEPSTCDDANTNNASSDNEGSTLIIEDGRGVGAAKGGGVDISSKVCTGAGTGTVANSNHHYMKIMRHQTIGNKKCQVFDAEFNEITKTDRIRINDRIVPSK